jgi:cupin superfamily acireductone dioxygenase involved in methionine salvage
MADGVRVSAEAAFAEEGLTPHTWSNEPDFAYGEHRHPYHKVLYCLAGAITFHTPQGDINMGPGDRLDLPPNTAHSATVGRSGVTCMEAARS